MEDRLAYDIKTAAQMLSLSPWTLRKWINQKKINATRLGSRVVLEKSVLDEILKRGRKGE